MVKCTFIFNNKKPGADLPPPPNTVSVNHVSTAVHPVSNGEYSANIWIILGDPEVTANIYWKSRNLPPIWIHKTTVQICGNFWVTQYFCGLFVLAVLVLVGRSVLLWSVGVYCTEKIPFLLISYRTHQMGLNFIILSTALYIAVILPGFCFGLHPPKILNQNNGQ